MEENKISECEWEVMRLIWSDEPITANEIIEKLSEKFQWKPKTIKTFIARLVKKDFLTYKKVGKEYVYESKIKKDDWEQVENKSFVKKVYDGAVKNLLVSFLNTSSLSKDDITELRKILNDKEEEN